MGIGVVGISTTQKKEPVPQPGPPFTSDSAVNGLSVDSVSGKMVLGNDAGDPTEPAALLNDREILTDDPGGGLFSLALKSDVTDTDTALDGQSIRMTSGDFTNPQFRINTGQSGFIQHILQGVDGAFIDIRSITDTGGQIVFSMVSGAQSYEIHNIDFAGSVDTLVDGVPVHRVYTSSPYNTQIGGTLVSANNNADLQVSGTVTKRLFTQSQGAGTYNVNRDLDSAKLIRNSGALILALPTMTAGNARPGFYIDVLVFNSAGITVDAPAGVTIRFGSLVTSAGGTLVSTDVGAMCRVINIDGSTWVTASFCGAWALT